jgi:hypothetical protein
MHNSHYENTEVKTQLGGSKTVRKVIIKNGKGFKSVTKFRNGKKMKTIKKHIPTDHITLILEGKFIPGLFSDCDCREKSKTKKNKRALYN